MTMPGLPRIALNASVGQPNSAQIGCETGRPHWPAYGAGADATRPRGSSAEHERGRADEDESSEFLHEAPSQ